MAKNKISLNGHEFRNGVFVAPFNTIEGISPCNWFTERVPEYLWLGLLLDSFDDRKQGLQKIMQMLQRIFLVAQNLEEPALSKILALNETIQQSVYQIIEDLELKEHLLPLNLVYSYSEYPVLSIFLTNEDFDYVKCQDVLESVIRKMNHPQSEFTTDVKFLVLFYRLCSGHLRIPMEVLENISLYPTIDHSDERMRSIRPTVRSMEMSFFEKDRSFADDFWRKCGAMFECKPYILKYEKDVSEEIVEEYSIFIKNVFLYYGDLYRITNPLNEKMLVLLGLATYSYKRFLEIIEHDLFNTISGRSIVRVIIEDFIMMKYLLKEEQQNQKIWEEYQSYGMGELKLVTERFPENGIEPNAKTHFDLKYLNILVDVYKSRMLQDMDTRAFKGGNAKQKFEAVGEKELYLIYDYDSAFEHGLWSAIRESSLLACDAPGHQFHCVPDVENRQKMKSVWHDVVVVMNKTIKLLVDEFGISDELKKRMPEYGL